MASASRWLLACTCPEFTQLTLVLAMVVFALIGVAVQDLGGILAGGATDPNAAPLVVLTALIYWPLTTTREIRGDVGPRPSLVADGA